MKDALLQSMKDIEPTIHQMTCTPSEHNGNVFVLAQSLISVSLWVEEKMRRAKHRETQCEEAVVILVTHAHAQLDKRKD